jgi:hypothetical protein
MEGHEHRKPVPVAPPSWNDDLGMSPTPGVTPEVPVQKSNVGRRDRGRGGRAAGTAT